jgi:hypothetical protein
MHGQPVVQPGRQVIVQREQLPEVAGREGLLDPLHEFVQGQPAGDERVLEDLNGAVPVGI